MNNTFHSRAFVHIGFWALFSAMPHSAACLHSVLYSTDVLFSFLQGWTGWCPNDPRTTKRMWQVEAQPSSSLFSHDCPVILLRRIASDR